MSTIRKARSAVVAAARAVTADNTPANIKSLSLALGAMDGALEASAALRTAELEAAALVEAEAEKAEKAAKIAAKIAKAA